MNTQRHTANESRGRRRGIGRAAASAAAALPLLLTTAFVGGAPAGASAPARPAALTGVSCVTSTSCIAVGYANSDNPRALIERFDGQHWTRATFPVPGDGASQFNAVSCVDAHHCLAVGIDVDGVVPFAERLTPSGWSILSPKTLALKAGFDAVDCVTATDCLAIGSDQEGGAFSQHWNGSSWTLKSIPSPHDTSVGLNAVTCRAAKDCIAVGDSMDNGTAVQRALVEHWNGSTWSVVPTPNPKGSAGSALHGVSCTSSTQCIAVGATGTEYGIYRALVERWDGTTWTIEHGPGASGANLAAVSCGSSSQCAAVGGDDNGLAGFHRNSSSWTVEPVQQPAGGMALAAVSCADATHCFAVGDAYTDAGHAVIERRSGSHWTLESPA